MDNPAYRLENQYNAQICGTQEPFRAYFLGLSAFAEGLPLSAPIRVNHEHPFAIQGLAFFDKTVPIRIEEEGSPDQQLVATVHGVFSHQDWGLIGPDKTVLASAANTVPKQKFEIKVILTSKKTPIHFIAIGPSGKTEEATVDILYPEYESSSEGSNELPSLGDSWGVALGVTSSTFSQTGLSDLSEVALTPKVSYQHPLNNHWDIGGNLFLAVPIFTNLNGINAYFFGANVRAGYSIPFIPKPWTLSLAGGGYFTTMFTNGQAFGYRNMFGPQIFPVLRRSLGEKDMLGTYFKYSPVSQGGAAFSFASHELATGISFTRLLPKRRSVSLTLDYSKISVDVYPNTATNSAFTGSVAYGF